MNADEFVSRPLNLPTAQMPAALLRVYEVRGARFDDHRQAGAAVAAAQAAVDQADREDLGLRADAADEGRDDPGTPNRDAAVAKLDQAREHQQVQQLRLERAHGALLAALELHADEWAEGVRVALARADAAAGKALAKLRAVEATRSDLRGTEVWILVADGDLRRALSKGHHFAPPAATRIKTPNGEPLTAGALLDVLDDFYGAGSPRPAQTADV